MGHRGKRSPLHDPRKLREAYDAHGPELYRFALRQLGDSGAAQDVVQEVFIRAWRSADRYDPQLSSLRVWLFAIARNAVIDEARRRNVRPWQPLADDASDEARQPIEDFSEGLLSSWLVEEALLRVNAEHRHAIVETYLRGRPPAEVAAEANVPPGTLRSRLFYGLKAMRVAMEELGVKA